MSAATSSLAFGAGVLSFATPCVLPLVPGYLAAVGGIGPTTPGAARRRADAARRRPFVLGFGGLRRLRRARRRSPARARRLRAEIAPGGRASSSSRWGSRCSAGALPLPSLPATPASRARGAALVGAPRRGLRAQLDALRRAGAGGRAGALGDRGGAPQAASCCSCTRRASRCRPDRERRRVRPRARRAPRSCATATARRARLGRVLVALGLLVFFDRTWWLSVASHVAAASAPAAYRRSSASRGSRLPSAGGAIHVHGADLMIYSRIETQLAPLGHSVQRARAARRVPRRTSASATWSASSPRGRSPICVPRSCSDSARTSSRRLYGRAREAGFDKVVARSAIADRLAALVDELML